MKHLAIPLWCRHLLWLVFIWFASVIALGIVAYVLRFLMATIGMTAAT